MQLNRFQITFTIDKQVKYSQFNKKNLIITKHVGTVGKAWVYWSRLVKVHVYIIKN